MYQIVDRCGDAVSSFSSPCRTKTAKRTSYSSTLVAPNYALILTTEASTSFGCSSSIDDIEAPCALAANRR
jgi:hypothetical protein